MIEMQKIAPLHQADIEAVQRGKINVEDIIWISNDGGEQRLREIEDNHFKNIALKLMGFSTSEYEGSMYLKMRWITILKIEWERRMKERKVSNFSKK